MGLIPSSNFRPTTSSAKVLNSGIYINNIIIVVKIVSPAWICDKNNRV